LFVLASNAKEFAHAKPDDLVDNEKEN